jgi:hypothetical protein
MTAPVTIVARPGTPGLDTARGLLSRNDLPHRWVDLDRDPLAHLIDMEGLRDRRLPLVLFPDGSTLRVSRSIWSRYQAGWRGGC